MKTDVKKTYTLVLDAHEALTLRNEIAGIPSREIQGREMLIGVYSWLENEV